MSFFDELKRRNVFRVGVAYLVSAWVLLQVVDLVLENIQAPEWVMKVFMLALAIGFPLAVFFAWAFEVTPDGIRKEKDVDRSQSIASQTGRKLDRSIIVILLVAVVYFAWDNFSLSTPDTQPAAEITQQVTTVVEIPKSIAVLPFTDLSETGNQEFFSDGIAEEILNVLASIPDLKVAARTSAFAYKGTNTNISKIAKDLGVNHILEGSVRKSGNQVRVTAQLIKADDGFHLWSENYDRELTNIFTIQDEIAGSIADALKVSLQLETGTAGNLTGTRSIEAYEHYLKGMSLWHERTAISLARALEEFEAAASLDQQFAKAYAGQAITWAVIYGYTTLAVAETGPKATVAANRALSLDPENVESIAALGVVARSETRYADAAGYFERAMQLNPSYASAYQWYGGTLGEMGDPDAGLAMYRKAWSLDPRSRIIGYNLAWRLNGLGHAEEAEQVAMEVVSFAPEFPDGLNLVFGLKIMGGDCAGSRQYGDRLATLLKKEVNSTQLYLDLCQKGDPALRSRAIEAMLAWPEIDFANPAHPALSYEFDLIDVLTELGEFDAAWKFIERYAANDPTVLGWLRTRETENGIRLRCDRRVRGLTEQSGLPTAIHLLKCS